MIVRLICALLILFLFDQVVACQPIYAQENLSTFALQKEIWFDQIIGVENSGLINGPEYFISLQGSKTHPFFGSREITYESLVVDGQFFGNVPVMYDIYSNTVVIRHRDKKGLFALITLQKNVDSFTLYGHTFKKLSLVEVKGEIQSPQLFDILLEGEKVSLVAKRKKEIYMQDGKPEYRQEDLFYFLINGQKVLIIRKKDIYETFKVYEDEVRHYIKTNNLNVRSEKDLIKVVRFCDSLTQVSSK